MDVHWHDWWRQLSREARWSMDFARNCSLHGTSLFSPSLLPLHPVTFSSPSPHLVLDNPALTLSQLDKVREGLFYILVPDNETRPQVDQLRVMWAAGDVAESRPALSRWHKDYKALFEDYMREGLAQLE